MQHLIGRTILRLKLKKLLPLEGTVIKLKYWFPSYYPEVAKGLYLSIYFPQGNITEINKLSELFLLFMIRADF